MVLKVKLKIRHVGCISEKVTGSARVIHMSGDGRHCLSVFKASSEEQLETLLSGNGNRLVPHGVVDRSERWAVARCDCPMRGGVILPIFKAMGCTVLWPTVEADGHEFYTIVAPSRSRLRAVVERLQEEGEVTLERVSDVPGDALEIAVPLSDLTQELTQRQFKALVTAVRAGYYDTPRSVYADDLAKAMGISRSTFQEHLQKAEASVMRTFATLVAEHPALEAQADRGPGRPAKHADTPMPSAHLVRDADEKVLEPQGKC